MLLLLLLATLSSSLLIPGPQDKRLRFTREASSLWKALSRAERASSWTYDRQDLWWQQPDSEACRSGLAQSPVAIQTNSAVCFPGLALQLPFACAAGDLSNNGHTIEVELSSAVKPLVFSTVLYPQPGQLLQFHFHSPSEHTINGRQYPLELHFVHMTSSGR